MPKYLVLQKSFIDNKLHEEGDIVEYDGVPAGNLEAIDAPAKKAPKADTKKDLARQQAAAAGANPNTGAPVDAPPAASGDGKSEDLA